jgi:hypothetical protein
LGVVGGFIAVSVGAVVLSPPVERVSGAGSYLPLDAPQRLLDSRPGATTADGQFAAIGIRAGGSTLALRVAGRVGIPVGADAVALNVTAVDPLGVGFLTVFPCDAGQPNASNLNYGPGTNVANAVIAKLGTDGDVCIYTFAVTHLVVDVAGYLPAGSYVPLVAPQRLMDTRPNATTADGVGAGDGLRSADSITDVQVAGRVDVPSDAGVVVLNVTAVDPSGVGFLTVFPCGAPVPNVSNLNFYAGSNIANTVVGRLSVGGKVCIYTFTSTHLVVDVAGHLPADTFVPLTSPQRLADSRPGATTADGQFAGIGLRGPGSALQLQVAGRVGVPATAGAVVLNVTAVDPTDVGFLTVFPTGAGPPTASNLNYDAGRNVANTVIARIGRGGNVCIYTFAATHLVVDVAGYLPGPTPITSGPDCPQPRPEQLALEVLAAIPVQAEQPSGYDRSLFPHWLDLDGDGCSTRAEVLIRDSLTPAQVDPFGCEVVAGDWLSPYDGRQWTSPSDVDIDHVVALKEAWDSGAWSWSTFQRTQFANDLDDRRTLRAVTDSVNQSKSDSDPSNWLPPLSGDWCRYLGDWIAIKARWHLTMDQSEVGQIRGVITTQCAALTIPAWPPAPVAAPPATPPPTTPPSNCAPSYPTVCIPPPPPDLDCGEIPYRNFTALPPDPHNLDGDNDESAAKARSSSATESRPFWTHFWCGRSRLLAAIRHTGNAIANDEEEER